MQVSFYLAIMLPHFARLFLTNSCLILLGGMLAACSVISPTTSAESFAAENEISENFYYNQRTIELIVPFAAGGGTDTWARSLAPILQRHLEGDVRIQVINHVGASGIAGANHFSRNHSPETILVSSGSIFFPYLFGDSTGEYDFNDYIPIIGSPVGGVVFVSPDTGIRSAQDLCNTQVSFTYSGISASGSDIVALIAFELLELDVDALFGFGGRSTTRLMFENGESTIEYQTTPGYFANVSSLVEDGRAIPLFSFGQLDQNGDMVRDPAFPNIPSVYEVYEACNNQPPSGVIWDAYKSTLIAGFGIQKVMWVHSETPEQATSALRDAAALVAKDPLFQETAKDLIGDYDFYVGHEAQITFAAATNVPTEAITWLKSLIDEKYSR